MTVEGGSGTPGIPCDVGPETMVERYRLAASVLPESVEWWTGRARPKVAWSQPEDLILLLTRLDGWSIIQIRGEGQPPRVLLTAEGTAERLSDTIGQRVVATELHQARIRVTATAAHLRCDGACWVVWYDSARVEPCSEPVDGMLSPDGEKKAYVREGNIWIWQSDRQNPFPLTVDGEPARPYGLQPSVGRRAVLHRYLGRRPNPAVVWSDDSAWLATHFLREDELATVAIVDSVPGAGRGPVWRTQPYALPLDAAVPLVDLVLLEARPEGRRLVGVTSAQTEFHSPVADGYTWWDGAEACYQLTTSRDWHSAYLHRTSTVDERTELVYTESYATWADFGPYPTRAPLVCLVPGSQEFIWFSSAGGEGSLWVHDLVTGRKLRRIGLEDYLPEKIVRVDAEGRFVIALVSDWRREPYRARLAKLSLDGAGLEFLTEDDGLSHEVISTSPSGSRLVETASSTTIAPRVTLRNQDGCVVANITDPSDLPVPLRSFPAPERVTFLAEDGVTALKGTLYFPPGFDSDGTYPLIDDLYPGPQHPRASAAHWALCPGDELAFAALGFLVLTMDGRGTPGRGKGFHEFQYKAMQTAGYLTDHVAAIGQLAERFKCIDKTRIGCVGKSGGGFAAFRGLAQHPDTFKTAVCVSGDHDQRFYHARWVEHWHCADGSSFDGLSNNELAADISGKLLLIHGEVDDSVLLSQTMRLVDSLVSANRDFELLIVPRAEHNMIGRRGYVARRIWDFLVRELASATSPKEFLVPEAPPDFYERYM